jgi:hypothetical protein
VEVDGRRLEGETPVTLTLSTGRHRVRVTHDGYAARDATVEILDGRRTTWHAVLTNR